MHVCVCRVRECGENERVGQEWACACQQSESRRVLPRVLQRVLQGRRHLQVRRSEHVAVCVATSAAVF